MHVANDDTRKVMAYLIPHNDQFVERFKQIVLAEQQMQRYIIYVRHGQILHDEPENIQDIQSKLDKLQANILYKQLLETGQENVSFVINMEIYHNFIDVTFLDNDFIAFNEDFTKFDKYDEYNKFCLQVTDQDNNHLGMIWTFSHRDYPYLGMIGIRSTFIRYLLKNPPKKYTGIASLLISGVKYLAKTLDKTQIVVPNPLPVMQKILKKHGFIEHGEWKDLDIEDFEDDSDDEENFADFPPERKFIYPITSTSNYYTLQL